MDKQWPPISRHAQRHHRPLAHGIKAKWRGRSQFHHVIDIAPTVLEAAGIPAQPSSQRSAGAVRRRQQVYAFNDARRPSARDPYSRCSATGASPSGLDGGPPARRPLDWYVRVAPSTRMFGSYIAPIPTSQSRTSPRRIRETARAAAAVPDRSGQVQRAPARRPPFPRFNPDLAGRLMLIKARRSCCSAA